jgi:hypothetical protein
MKLTLPLSPWIVTRFLLRVVIVLAVLSYVGQLMHYFLPPNGLIEFFAKAFNVDREKNIPTAYSGFGLLLSSILLAVIAYAKKLDNDRYTRHWIMLSGLFLYLCLDEVGKLHERLIDPMHDLIHGTGFLYFGWIVPASILVALIGLYYLKFLFHLPIKFRKLFILSAVVFLGGALGMESIGGYYVSHYTIDDMIYQSEATIEESLEMLGIVMFIHALLSYIVVSFKDLIIEVRLEDLTKITEEKSRDQTLVPEGQKQELS